MRRLLLLAAAVGFWTGSQAGGAADPPAKAPPPAQHREGQHPHAPPRPQPPVPSAPSVSYFPWYSPWGYSVYDPTVYPVVPSYYGGPIIFPPLYLPAETMYGPEAVKRFMGVDGAGLSNNSSRAFRGRGGDEDDDKPVVQRGTNAESVALGRRFIRFGDAQFAKQKYADALLRYKKATQAAPALADAWFRQGYAQVASGRYDQAVKAFKQGLKLDPGWPRSGFSNTQVYAENHAAETAHLDALAKAAEQDRNNPDLLFLVGVCLHFGPQPERAQPFFQRAVQLAGADTDHIQAFLNKAEK